MKRIGVLFLIFYSLLYSFAFAQDSTKVPDSYYPYSHPFPNKDYPKEIDSSIFFHPRMLQPIVGVGPGILTFYGDIKDKPMLAPSISRLGYHLSVSEYLQPWLIFSARAMFGTVGANESAPPYRNFQSTIKMGGINLIYNFDNFLPKKRKIDPFILTGFEYFEFNTKTDMYDANGNKYYYWSDGSIMNLPQNDPNAANAIHLTRDYTYETDVRKLNNEIFGKYPERSFSIPLGIGFTIHPAPRWDFKMGTTMHFSFSDHIDGITPANSAPGEAKPNKDKFLETYFTIAFHLFNPKPPFVSPLSDEELLALENEDSDSDGVKDFDDKCPGTPPGVAVDAGGCPPDADGDGVPDYLDKEINSPAGAFVDSNGVAMDDSTIARKWRVWSDSTNQYVTYVTVVNPPAVASEGWANNTTAPRESTVVYRKELTVLLGEYKQGIPPAEMGKLLSVADVSSSMQPDSSTAYTSGTFNSSSDAEKRKQDLIASGFPKAKIMMRNKDGSLSEPTANEIKSAEPKNKISEKENPKTSVTAVVKPTTEKAVVYRVQLGAYSRKLSSSVFKNAGQMLEMKTEDGLYKYVSGSYPSVQDAMKARDELLKRGYAGAFVVAYKDSKRVPLSSVSVGMVPNKNENMEEPKMPKSAVDKKLVSFSVQVGAFVNEPPADIMKKLEKIPGLEKKKKASGITQYVAGKFNDIASAQKFKDDVIKKYGFPDAFLVAFFKDEMISVQEATELLK